MSAREVRFPAPELASFLEELNPDANEIEQLKRCLKSCLDSVEAGKPQGDPVPFHQYPEYPNVHEIKCGQRFILVYAFDEEELFPVEILLASDYKE